MPDDLKPFNPDWTLAPAAILAAWMRENDISLLAMAGKDATLKTYEERRAAAKKMMGVLGKEPLKQDLADLLERCTGVPADYWLRAESNYRNDLQVGRKDLTDEHLTDMPE